MVVSCVIEMIFENYYFPEFFTSLGSHIVSNIYLSPKEFFPRSFRSKYWRKIEICWDLTLNHGSLMWYKNNFWKVLFPSIFHLIRVPWVGKHLSNLSKRIFPGSFGAKYWWKIGNCWYLKPNHGSLIWYLINIYKLISVCLSLRYVLMIWETAHFSQKSRLKVKTYIYRSME